MSLSDTPILQRILLAEDMDEIDEIISHNRHINTLSWDDIKIGIVNNVHIIHKIIGIHLVLNKTIKEYPLHIKECIYLDILQKITIMNMKIDKQITSISDLCKKYCILFTDFYDWFCILVSKASCNIRKLLPIETITLVSVFLI